MDKFIKALKFLDSNPHIENIDESTPNIDVTIIKQLYDHQLIDVIDCSSKSGLSFLEPRINLNGYEWLQAQKNTNKLGDNEDIVDVKPNFMGVGLNVNALFRRIRNRNK